MEAITFTNTGSSLSSPTVIAAGKTADYQMIGNGGSEFVESGGMINVATITAGGVQDVLAGGITNYTVIDAGVLGVAGVANRSQVTAGGYEVVQAGGKSVDAHVFPGGYEYVLSGGTAAGSTIAFQGTMLVAAGGTTSGAINFAGSDAVLSVAGAVLPATEINGFDNNSSNDAIILTGFTYAAGKDSATLGAGGILTLDLNGQVEKLSFDPAPGNAGKSFAVTTNSLDQVVIIDPAAGSKPNMDFLAPATAAGSSNVVAQIVGRSAALMQDVAANGLPTAAYQPALQNFAAIDTLNAVAGATVQLAAAQNPILPSFTLHS